MMELKPAQENGSQLDMYLFEKRFSLMVEASAKKTAAQLAGMQEQIKSLNDELIEIKRNMSSAKPVATTATTENKQAVAASKSEYRLRYGDYKPEDVPLEKYFYFGNKKR